MTTEYYKDFKQSKKKKQVVDDKLTNNFSDNRIELYGVDYRISSDNQKDNDSIDTQRALALKFIEKKGGVLVREYVEEAESAFHKKAWEREGIVKLLDDVKEGKINHVVFFKRDRLARDIDSARYIYGILRECGAKLSFTDKSEPPVDLNKMDFATEVIEMMHYASNNHESRKTQIRVSNVMYEIAKSGRITGGQPPIGYEIKHINGDTYFEFIDKHRDTIKLIEKLYLEGMGLRLIARYLNGGEVKGKKSLKTPIEKPITNSKVSTAWNDKNIDTVLFNPIYTGHIHYNPSFLDEEPIIIKSKYVEAIRSDELQMQLNQLRKSRITAPNSKKKYTTPFLLTGLIRCGCCGEMYTTRTSQKKDGARHSYYSCKNRNSANPDLKCKDSLNFRHTIIEEFIKDKVYKILEALTTPDVYDISLNLYEEKDTLAENQLKTLREELSKYNKKVLNFMNLLGNLDLSNEGSLVLREMYEKGLVESKKEESEIKSKIAELESITLNAKEEEVGFEVFLNSLKEYKGVFDLIPHGNLIQIIESLFSEIIVDGEGNVILKLKFKIEPKHIVGEIETVISNTTIGEPIIADSITQTANQTLLLFRYFDYLTTTKELVQKHLWNYLVEIDKKLTDFSLHEVDSLTIKRCSNYNQLERSVLNKYFEKKTSTNRNTRLYVQNGKSVSKKTFLNIVNGFNLSMADFVKFIRKHENIAVDQNVIFESFEGVANTNEDVYTERLKCSHCGNRHRMFFNINTKYYRCVKARSDVKNPCKTEGVNEKYLDVYFKNNNINVDKVKNIYIKNGLVEDIEFA